MKTNTPPEDAKVFTHIFTVDKTAIDNLGHVNNLVYLKWVLEISERHWASVVPDRVKETLAWVVLSHHIHYKQQAFEGDTIAAKTWVNYAHGVTSERAVLLYRDKTLLVQCVSNWCLLDATSKKPKRIDNGISSLFKNQLPA